MRIKATRNAGGNYSRVGVCDLRSKQRGVSLMAERQRAEKQNRALKKMYDSLTRKKSGEITLDSSQMSLPYSKRRHDQAPNYWVKSLLSK